MATGRTRRVLPISARGNASAARVEARTSTRLVAEGSAERRALMKMLRGFAVLVAFVAILMLIVAGPGTRFGLWNFRIGLALLRYAPYVGVAAIVLSLIVLVASRPRGGALALLVVALAFGCTSVVMPWKFFQRGKQVPPIHDITTDTREPPQFVAVLPLRKNAVNSATYGGDSVATLQQKAFPDIRPLHLSMPPGQAFERALTAAKATGWTIDAADSTTGRIEATATTRWFGFKDDVVVRIRAEGDGSRVDVRSVSRVGKSDLGTNASRVRAYLARLVSQSHASAADD
jgi:uncharacterized protein (DUF1499 family)